MKIFKENKMHKGWFIGNFIPNCFSADQFEVAIKRYNKGDYEDFHHHKIATEITAIISGKVEMNGQVFQEGDIILIEPKEGTDFKAIEDTVNVVIKVPSVVGDKYNGKCI